MSESLDLSILSLVGTFSLVLVAIFLSYRENLGLIKDILYSTSRMIIQLVAVGFLLTYVFDLDSNYMTIILLCIMDINAAYNASKRGAGIENSFKISLIAIFLVSFLSIFVLITTKSIKPTPNQMIPINGMVIGNSMNAIGLAFRNLKDNFKSNKNQILEKLSLGANIRDASKTQIRNSIKVSLQPTIDSVKTVGIVQLPGMMTGLIFAGNLPISAIMYQIMIYFLIIGNSTITTVLSTYLAYPNFFTKNGQLK